jgi:NAD-dependent dihydropyrimidine dehydrogenase PreA subunit
VEQETGWRCTFGPVYAEDIPAYLAASLKKTDDMRQAKFPLGARMEMAVMWAGPMSLIAGIPVAIFSLPSLPGVLALIWVFSLFLFAFYDPVLRYVPGPAGLIKTAMLGGVGAAGVVAYGLTAGQWSVGAILAWSLGTLAVALVLGFDLDGSSPLYPGSTVAYWGRKVPAILRVWAAFGYEFDAHFALQVDSDRCNGCTTCVEVCPRGVFELDWQDGARTSRVAHPALCEQCTACVKQCPQGAILADPPIRGFRSVAEWQAVTRTVQE